MKLDTPFVLLLTCVTVDVSHTARILALLHYPGGSHFNTLGRLIRELATRGHHLTVVSHSPLDTTVANYTDISIKGSAPPRRDTFNFEHLSYAIIKEMGLCHISTITSIVVGLANLGYTNCERSYEHSAVKELIASIRSGEQQFDMVLLHTLMVDCFDQFAPLLGGVPLVAVSTNVLTPWASDRVGNPHNPAYVGTYLLSYETGNMRFYHRLLNAVYYLHTKTVRFLKLLAAIDAIHRKHLGRDMPPLEKTVSSTSLVLVNTHWSISGAVPLQPNVIEVGGLHIKQPVPLPEELDSFVAGWENGTVYCSFGSLFAFHTLPLTKMEAILGGLAKLSQGVLLRCDVSKLPPNVTLPHNVRADKWLPQTSILAHPNVRAFVSHGGMHSAMEAVHFGVPLVGIPLLGDQQLMLNRLQTLGVAFQQDYNQLAVDSFAAAVKRVINDAGYRKRVRQLSARFKDRPRPPLEEAVYWVEYVLRHRGAPHLRSTALDLAWDQYLLLDIATFVALHLLLMSIGLYYGWRVLASSPIWNVLKLKVV